MSKSSEAKTDHQEIGEEKIIHYNHRMQWIMVYMTRYWISTLHKTYSRDYNGLSFPHQFPDEGQDTTRTRHDRDTKRHETRRGHRHDTTETRHDMSHNEDTDMTQWGHDTTRTRRDGDTTRRGYNATGTPTRRGHDMTRTQCDEDTDMSCHIKDGDAT